MDLINDDEVFVDEVFQFAHFMLDFRIPGFYVRPPEPPEPAVVSVITIYQQLGALRPGFDRR